MMMPGRYKEYDWSRMGAQSQQKDDEVYGKGNLYAYKYRMHDARINRFFSPDPLHADYPYNSDYAFSENRLIDGTELEGREFSPAIKLAAKRIAFIGANNPVIAIIRATVSPVEMPNPEATAEWKLKQAAIQKAVPLVKAEDAKTENAATDKEKAQTGSYTNTHKSGKTYHGKGSQKRAEKSGREKESKNDDPLQESEWKPAKNDRDAFKDEARRIRNDGGIENPNNYNKINSPGEKILRQEEGALPSSSGTNSSTGTTTPTSTEL